MKTTLTLTAWEILAVKKALALAWQSSDKSIEPKGLAILTARFRDAKYVTIEMD